MEGPHQRRRRKHLACNCVYWVCAAALTGFMSPQAPVLEWGDGVSQVWAEHSFSSGFSADVRMNLTNTDVAYQVHVYSLQGMLSYAGLRTRPLSDAALLALSASSPSSSSAQNSDSSSVDVLLNSTGEPAAAAIAACGDAQARLELTPVTFNDTQVGQHGSVPVNLKSIWPLLTFCPSALLPGLVDSPSIVCGHDVPDPHRSHAWRRRVGCCAWRAQRLARMESFPVLRNGLALPRYWRDVRTGVCSCVQHHGHCTG